MDLEGRAGPPAEGFGAEDVVDVAVGGEDAPDAEVGLREPQDAGDLAARIDHQRVAGIGVGDEPGVLGKGSDDRLPDDQHQAEKDDPQPQVFLALGFTNLNPAPCSPVT